jgi:hypothetical protein
MGTPREELRALVESLPDEMAADVLDFVRAIKNRARPGESTFDGGQQAWPPAWFGAGRASRSDVSEHVDEILRNEFGRRGA